MVTAGLYEGELADVVVVSSASRTRGRVDIDVSRRMEGLPVLKKRWADRRYSNQAKPRGHAAGLRWPFGLDWG